MLVFKGIHYFILKTKHKTCYVAISMLFSLWQASGGLWCGCDTGVCSTGQTKKQRKRSGNFEEANIGLPGNLVLLSASLLEFTLFNLMTVLIKELSQAGPLLHFLFVAIWQWEILWNQSLQLFMVICIDFQIFAFNKKVEQMSVVC